MHRYNTRLHAKGGRIRRRRRSAAGFRTHRQETPMPAACKYPPAQLRPSPETWSLPAAHGETRIHNARPDCHSAPHGENRRAANMPMPLCGSPYLTDNPGTGLPDDGCSYRLSSAPAHTDESSPDRSHKPDGYFPCDKLHLHTKMQGVPHSGGYYKQNTTVPQNPTAFPHRVPWNICNTRIIR